MKIGLVLRELYRSEEELLGLLLSVAHRHAGDHEVVHVARDAARWSRRHLEELESVGQRLSVEYQKNASGDGAIAVGEGRGPLGEARDPGLELLRDLRTIFLQASGVSTDWEMIAQAAQGVKDPELLAVAQRCHPDTLRQARWANAKLKESSTQVLIT